MSNTSLCNYYMSLPKTQGLIPETLYTDIKKTIDDFTHGSWTYEIVNEFPVNNDYISVTVMVYMPGRVLTGRIVSPKKEHEYGEAHLRAILDAVSLLIDKKTVYQTAPPVQTNQQPEQLNSDVQQVAQNMTAEQISAMLGQNGTEMINTATQFYNHTENGVDTGEVPMDQMTDNCVKELQEELQMPVNSTTTQGLQFQNEFPMNPPQENVPPDYNNPKPEFGGYSQRQIDAMNRIKQNANIDNDDKWKGFVRMWHSEFTNGKRDLNPQNVDDFISFMEMRYKKKFMGI